MESPRNSRQRVNGVLKEADIEEEQEYSPVEADIVTLLFKSEKLLIHGIIINSNTLLKGAERGIVMTILDRVEVNPRVMMGKPVIRGTRIPVELIVRKATDQDILDAYPRLKKGDIQAALRYAADALAHEEVVVIGPSRRLATK
jgi:uncharacterized protein (DUF433 family)